jgi:tRNA 2-thiouridine synthesizing protein A
VTTDFDAAIATNPKPVDLRGIPCPLSFVRAKLQIEKIAAGEQLEIWLDGGEPIEQVPNSLSVDGHVIHGVESRDGYFALVVEKKQPEA